MSGTNNSLSKIRKTKDSSFDRIYRFYHKPKSNQVLDADDERIRERLEKAWYILCKHRSIQEVVNLLGRIYNIKKSVAYDDVNNAMMLFSDPRSDVKDAKRAIAESAILRGANRAWKQGDMKSYKDFWKEYSEINNLKGDDDNRLKELLKKQRPVSITFVTDADQLKRQASDLMKDVALDTDFESVNEGDKKES